MLEGMCQTLSLNYYLRILSKMIGQRFAPKPLATIGFFGGTDLAGRQGAADSAGLFAPVQLHASEVVRGKPFHWSRTVLSAQDHGGMHSS